MAIVDQNLIKFESDAFTVRYIVTDGTNISGYSAWWGLSEATSYNTLSSATCLEKHTAFDPVNTDSNCNVTAVGASTGGMTVAAGYVDVVINYNETDGYPHDGGFNSDGLYYYELILSEDGGQCASAVAASGFFDMRQALFNSQDYRGTY